MASNQKQPVSRSVGRWLWEWIKSITIALVVWFFLQAMLIKAFRIPSGSMEHTILVGDFLFVNKALYGAEIPFTAKRLPALRQPRHNDIVVFDSVEEPGLDVVKRLVGLAGDTLQMRNDSVFRNGEYLPEPYVQHLDPFAEMDDLQRRHSRRWQLPHFVGSPPPDYLPDLRNWGPVVIPAHHAFVMGDNRDQSYDARYWGFLPVENIQGRPMFVYFSYDPSSWRPLPFFTAVRWRRLFARPH